MTSSKMPTLLVAALAVVVSPAVVYQVLRAQGDAREAALRTRIGSTRAALLARRWERPVLRAPTLDADAGALDLSWTRGIPLESTRQITDAVRNDVPLSAESRALIESHREQLAAMRVATHGRYVQGAVVGLTGSRSSTTFSTIQATRMLFASALDAPPEECFRIAADAVRVAQDHSLSEGLIGLAGLTLALRNATKVANRCAASATREDLTAAASEFDVLASHPPPQLDMLDVEVLRVADGMDDNFRFVPKVPRSRDDLMLAWYRPRVLPVYEGMLSDLATRRAHPLQAQESVPSETRAVIAALDRRDAALPELFRASPVYTRYFAQSDTALAELRDTAARLRAASLTRPAAPPTPPPTPSPTPPPTPPGLE